MKEPFVIVRKGDKKKKQFFGTKAYSDVAIQYARNIKSQRSNMAKGNIYE